MLMPQVMAWRKTCQQNRLLNLHKPQAEHLPPTFPDAGHLDSDTTNTEFVPEDTGSEMASSDSESERELEREGDDENEYTEEIKNDADLLQFAAKL